MRRTLIRLVSVGVLVGMLATATAGAAGAAHAQSRFGGRAGGFGPRGAFGFGFGYGSGSGLAGPGGRMPIGGGGPGGLAPGGGDAAILGTDMLTPTASFLGISVSTLESDLASGKTLAQEATAHGQTASALIAALVKSETTILDGDKAAGWITADQETTLISQLTKEITTLVNNGPPVPPSESKPAGLLQTAAGYLGISVSELQSDLKGGKSLADVVSSVGNGKTVDGLVSALEAPAKSNLDSAVSAGKITQAQENAILAKMTTSLTNLVNDTKPSSSTMNGVIKQVTHYATLKKFGKLH